MSEHIYTAPELLPPIPMAALAPPSARAVTSIAVAGLALFAALGVWRSGSEPVRPFTAPAPISAPLVQRAPPALTPAPVEIANGQPAALNMPMGAAAGGEGPAVAASQLGGGQ